jgi:PAS domain S-box-containing protein
MTLQKRTLFITSITLIVLLGSIFTVLYFLIRNNFLIIEKRYSTENGLRVRDAINQEIESLATKLVDWAHWDDPYDFLTTHDPAFITNNLAEGSIDAIKLNALLILDEKLDIVADQISLPADDDKSSYQRELQQLIKSHISYFTFKDANENMKGILSLPSGKIIMIAAQGITTSDLSAPIKGAIVFTRIIDDSFIKNIGQITHLKIAFETDKAEKSMFTPQNLVHQIIQTDTIETVIGMLDVEGNLVLYLDIESPRDIFMQGMSIVRYFSFLLCGIAVLFIFLNTYLMSRLVIKPIQSLIRGVKKVSVDPQAKTRISMEGKGEIHDLAENINKMLGSLEKSYSENEDKSKELAATRIDLEQQVLDFQKQNETLEQSKQAVMNILDDSRRLEIELRKQRDRNSAVIASMGEGLVVIDEKFCVRIMNPVAERLAGAKEKDVKGTPWSNVVTMYKDNESVSSQDRPFVKAFKEKTSVFLGLDDNIYYQTKDGRRMPISASVTPIFSDDKMVNAAVILFHDITREKTEKTIIEQMVKERTQELVEKNIVLEKTQQDLAVASHEAESEQAKLMASIDSLTLGFIMTDENEHVLTVNEMANTMLGLKGMEDVMDLSEIEKRLYPAVDLHAIHNQCKNEKKSVHIDNFEYKEKYFRLFIAPILVPGEGQKLIGTVIVLEDITEAKILERSREEFFSIASHELRTPLTAIRGNTELIRQYYGDKIQDPDFKEMIDDIHSGSVRLITLVNDFLDMSRIEQGRMKYTLVPFDFSELIEKTLVMLEALCTEKKITLSFEKPQIPVMVSGDPDKSKEIILNLVGNAIKFTENGTIKVSFDPTIAPPTGKIGQIIMAVTDSGRGIPLSNQNLLFRKFTQAGSSILTRDTTKGTGLGLYISKLMGEGMNGSVFLAHSEEGKGSTFAFSLPKAG